MYHFIGIKGSGMSALAQIMKELGYSIQGSDVEKYFFTEDGLHNLDIPVLPFHHLSLVPQSFPTLCDPMDCSKPGFPVHHQLP